MGSRERGKAMIRKERIERMLQELRYEIEIGMMQGEIDETLGFEFFVPASKSIPNGVVMCSFRTRPMPGYALSLDHRQQTRLKVVK